jgi:purine-binding chemotaxis protein CheW
MMDQMQTLGAPRGPAAPPAASIAHDQFITFTLGAEEYGVDIMAVREIKGWSETTSIPNAPGFIHGVINLRGIIVPIMDLRARFGMPPADPTRKHVFIIIDTRGRTVGLLVDTVSDIISVAPDAVRPIPDMGSGTRENLLRGLVAVADRMVSLVSMDGLIGPADARAADARPGDPCPAILEPAA